MSASPKFRLGAILWVAAMVGVVVVSMTIIPQLLEKAPPSVPPSVAIAVSMVQNGILVALAVWAGVALSPSLGMGAPTLQAALGKGATWSAFKKQLGPALVAGVLVGALLVLLTYIAPAQLVAIGETTKIPLTAKLLYGGVTEEVLVRWGLMSTLMWLGWRFRQKRSGPPRMSIVWGAIAVTALAFGIFHLPAAAAMGATLDATVVTFVIAGNAVPGLIFGYLYWRHGLESAIVAHALAHAVSVVAMT